MKKYINILRWIGLCENSANLYISLLENWKSSVLDISCNSWLHRVQIYRLLPNLIESWFVIKTQKWKRFFYLPANPEKINEEYERLFNNNQSVIDEMSSKYSSLNKKTNIIMNKWKKGIAHIYNDMVNTLDKWEVFYRITSEKDVDKINDYYIPKWYKKKRDEKEIERYIIMTEDTAIKKKKKLERQIKILDNKSLNFDDNIIFTIYKNKVSLIDFNSETSILIESSEFSVFLEKIFMLLFKKL